MSRLKTNLLANVAGASWTAVVQLLCVPVYVRLIGVEAYGLVGVFLAIQVSLQVFDLGFGLTLNRELARQLGQGSGEARIRSLARTLELVYWGIGLTLAAGFMLLAPVLAQHWFNTAELTGSELESALRLMALVLFFQWPFTFYQNGFNGMQQQVLFNGLRILFVSLSNFGAILALWFWSATVTTFFAWLFFAALLQALTMQLLFWRRLPGRGGPRPRFEAGLLLEVKRLAGGLGVIAVLGTILSQMDKIALSKLVTLEQLGYYTLAGVVAGSLQLFITPVFSAVFPRMSALVASGKPGAEQQLYHVASQLMAALLVPTTCLVVVFGPALLEVWTGDAETARRVFPLAVLLMVGTALNGMMHLPHALQLAHGWTSLAVKLALAKLVVFFPLMLWAIEQFGALGAATTWLALNAAYLVTGVPLTHRRLLRGDGMRWLTRDLGLPVVLVGGACAIVYTQLHQAELDWLWLAQLLLAAGLFFSMALAATPALRRELLRRPRRMLAESP